MKRVFVFVSCFAFVLLCTHFTRSQSTANQEKSRLIAELFTLTRTEQDLHMMGDAILRDTEESDRKTLRSTLGGPTCMTDKQKKDCEAKAAEAYSMFVKKFRDRLPKEINYREYIEKIIFPIYENYFSVAVIVRFEAISSCALQPFFTTSFLSLSLTVTK